MEPKESVGGETAHGAAKKHRFLKVVAGGIAGLAVLVLLILFITPLFLSSSGGTRFLLGKINQSVDGRVGMDDFSVGWFSGVKLTNLTYASDDGATEVKVGRIETQPRYTALVGGRVDLGKTVIDRPHVLLKLSALPEPPATPDKPAPPKDTTDAALFFPAHLIDLQVTDGSATIELTDIDAQVRRVSFHNIASNVELNKPGTTSRMNLSLDVANGQQAGSVKAEGQVTPPKKGWTLEDTDGALEVSIKNLDLESLRPLLALAGQDVQIGGVLNADTEVIIGAGTLQTLKADATVTHFSQGIGDQKTTFAEPVTLTAMIGMEDKAIRIDALQVRSDFFTVECSGDAETLDYAITADLAPTQAIVGQFADLGGYDAAGRLDVSGRLYLGEGTVATAGKGTVKRLLLSKDGAKAPQTDVSLEYDLSMDTANETLTVASATLAMLPGTVSITDLSMPIGHSGLPPMSLLARANLDMAKAWPYAQILADAPADIDLAGVLEATVAVETKDDILRIVTDNANIKKLRVAKAGSEPFVQDRVQLSADVTLDLVRQSIGIQTFDMQSAAGETLIKIIKGSVEQSGDEETQQFDAEIEAEYDLQTLSQFVSPFLPDGLKVQGKRKDSFVFSSRWPTDAPEQMRANLNGKGGFGFDKAEYYGLNFGPTEMTVNIEQGLAVVSIPETTVNNGTLRLAGSIDMKEDPMFFRLAGPTDILKNIQINDVITAQLLTYVNPVFAGASATSGVANLSCRKLALPLSGEHLDKMDIDGTVGITDVRLQAGDFLGQILTLLNQGQGVRLNLRPTDFLMQQGRVSYRDMAIELGDYPLNFSGSLGLDKRLAMNVKLPLSMEFRPVRLADAGVERLEVPLGGSVDKPSIDTARLIERQGQRLIEQQLQRLFR